MPRFARLLLLSFGFLTLILGAAVIGSPSAMAEAILIPNGPLVGDGKTASTLRVWIPGLSLEEKLKIKADQGKVGAPVATAEGIVSFTLIPPKVTGPGTLSVVIQRRGAAVIEERVDVPVAPPFEGTLKLSFDPPVLVAGAGTALVRLTPSSNTPQAAEARRFLLKVSAGTIDAPAPAGDGTWVARYTPPADLQSPRTVILTAVDSAAPDAIWGWATYALQVKKDVTVAVEPDAKVLLKVGERTYGPIQASAVGTASFAIDLDPSTPTANVQAVTKTGVKSNNVINLPRTDYNRLAIISLPSMIPAEPDRVTLPVRIVATDFAGNPSKELPTLRCNVGQVSAPVAAGEPGVFISTFTPSSTPGESTITAEYAGFKADVTVKTVPPLPRMDLTVEPLELPKNKSDFVVTVRVKDAGGTALPGRVPTLLVPEATVVKAIKDNGDGTYTASYKLKPKEGKATIFATPQVVASGLQPYRLLIWTRMNMGPADGITRVPVTIAAVDRYGLPVADVAITLATPRGDASLPPTVKTNAQGLATADLKLGQQTGLVVLRAQSSGLVAEAPFFQVAQGKTPPAFDVGGDPEAMSSVASWQGAIASTAIMKEGGAPTVGPPSAVAINTVPPYTTPGAAILVTFRVVDATGNPVVKAKPVVTSDIGRVGTLSNNGDGTFNVPVQLPPGKDGPMLITVVAQAATQSLTLPTFISTLQAAAAAPADNEPVSNAPTTSTASGLGVKVVKNKPKLARNERSPWLRVQGGIGAQAHDYSMTLLSSPADGSNATAPSEAVYVSGNFLKFDIGGAPTLGLTGLYKVLDTDFWAQLDLGFNYEQMSILQTGYSDVGHTFKLNARYRKPLAENWYWFGLGGYHNTKALLFRYADETRSSAELLAYPVHGVRLGGGAGWEKGPFWFESEASGTFAILPVIGMLRLQFSYEFRQNNYAFISFTEELRSMEFTFDDTGELVKVKDQQQPLMIGVGGAFR